MRLLLAILALCFAGCVAYPEKGHRARVANEVGDYETVARLAGAAAEDDPGDALVWKLEQGAALRALGRLDGVAALLPDNRTVGVYTPTENPKRAPSPMAKTSPRLVRPSASVTVSIEPLPRATKRWAQPSARASSDEEAKP